jgi:CPA1 family monovalent cation:H+ antiporter
VAFLITTLLFLLVGIKSPVWRLIEYAELVLVGFVLVVVVRAVIVYGLFAFTNRFDASPLSPNYQHALVWGGMHTIVPIALLLTLPTELPYREQLGALVFGVAVLSIVVQGLLMPSALQVTGANEDAAGT